jgi:hypothetical protein
MLTDRLHGAEPFLRSCQFCNYVRISQYSVEAEGSVPCSQEPSTAPMLSQSVHAMSSYLRSILILSFCLGLDLASGLFPYGFPTKILCAFVVFPMHDTCPVHLIPSSLTWREVQVMKLLITQFCPPSCHFTPLQSKYSPQHSEMSPVCVPFLTSEAKLHTHTKP